MQKPSVDPSSQDYTTTDRSQYDPSTAAYTSYGEGGHSAGEQSPYEKDDDGYSYSEGGDGESTYYGGEGGGGGGGSDGHGSYSDDDSSESEYSEGPRTRSWLEQQGAQLTAVGTLLKMQIDDLLDPNRGLLFTPRAQAPPRRAAPPRTAAISWRELLELKEELIAQMGEAEAMEVALEGGAVQESTATAARARLRHRIVDVEAKHAALESKVSELERGLQEERAAEKAEAAPLSAQLALARHDDGLLTIDEARSAEVGAAAAAAAARAAVQYGVLRTDLAELEAVPRGLAAWRQRQAEARARLAHGTRLFAWQRPPPREHPSARLGRWARLQRGMLLHRRQRVGPEGRLQAAAVWARLSAWSTSPTLELLEPNARGDGPQQDLLGDVAPTMSLELGRVTATELGVASLLGYAPSPPSQAALQAATCFTLHSLRAAPLHLKAADRAELSLWWFGLASLCVPAPGARLSPGALLWRVARLRYVESVGRQGDPVSWMQL